MLRVHNKNYSAKKTPEKLEEDPFSDDNLKEILDTHSYTPANSS
jgi:hypothetical protein